MGLKELIGKRVHAVPIGSRYGDRYLVLDIDHPMVKLVDLDESRDVRWWNFAAFTSIAVIPEIPPS